MTEPEHELITLCRRIFKENDFIQFVSFEVHRDDGDNQTYTLRRSEDTDHDKRRQANG